MAKLLQHQQDATYYTRTFEGGIVTRQIHPDGVAYLKYCRVRVGGEIPTYCMSELRDYGWLFTKDEMPFWGEVDWAPRWMSIQPRPLSELTPFRRIPSVKEWGGAGFSTPPSSSGLLNDRADAMRARVEQRRQEMLQSIQADIEAASLKHARHQGMGEIERDRQPNEITDQRRARSEARRRVLEASRHREEAAREEERQRREASLARNQELQKQKRQEAALKDAETRRRNAELRQAAAESAEALLQEAAKNAQPQEEVAREEQRQRQRREAARARNRELQELRKQKQREAALKGAGTRRHNAERGRIKETPDSLVEVVARAREIVIVPELRDHDHVTAMAASAATVVPEIAQMRVLESVAAPLPHHSPPAAMIATNSSSLPAWMREGRREALSPIAAPKTDRPVWRELLSPEARWTPPIWVGFLVIGVVSWLMAPRLSVLLVSAMLVYKLIGLVRQVVRAVMQDRRHLAFWNGASPVGHADEAYRRDRRLVLLLLVIALLVIGRITIDTVFWWIGVGAFILVLWSLREIWQLRSV